ncbi:MAG: class I poly(R)-hydroxyalkanoic acid synthase [Bacteroidetes bacterium]|nr:class I poly(R)-hydroxyalkanoic acid synthase [Bacteroidota bacterium]
MPNSIDNELQELIEDVTKASKKITQNCFENLTGYFHDERDIEKTYAYFLTKLFENPSEMEKVQDTYFGYLKNQQALWQQIIEHQVDGKKEYKPIITPDKGDRRFSAAEWNDAPHYFDFLKQNYLLFSKMANEIIDTVEIDDKMKKKLNFYNKHYIDAFSPSNFFATNPEAIKLAQETKGQSIKDGLKNFLKDIDKGRISQTNEEGFVIGENIAITKGSVIYENELIQLIQYTPSTPKVNELPLLIIPPWINKFYILDLQEKNSFVKFLVDKGLTVFMISWINPTPKMGHLSFDNYVEMGAIKAIETAQSITGAKKVNVLGYCLGGTLLGASIPVLLGKYKKADNPVNTASFLAAMIDFSDVGPMGDVIDQALVRKLERGELLHQGVMHGHDMERAFNLIRANDLIWSYVVNNYLKGNQPTTFDVLFWTNDNTNLPANMYIYYLRNMVLENKLSRKNALRICNTPIDIGKIDVPSFIIGLKDDHISPCHTVFTTTELVSGPVEFILGGSGHVMGAANPPSKNKYGYYIDGKLNNGFEEWEKTAKFHEGSWWTPWTEKILKQSGKLIPAPKQLGNGKNKIIESAPGRYVKEKCLCERIDD